ncbi:MAG: hypothetical protein RMK29_11740 [Myxococcales bacterium]|nr:hypothetical protein [Myxococcales bacterium]
MLYFSKIASMRQEEEDARMQQPDQASFARYLRERWASNGIEVGPEEATPYREFAAGVGGWSFGLSVARDGLKARAGVWLLPAGKTIQDLAGLRNHYQGTLQRQNRFVRISSCNTELGSFFLFWDATQPLPQEQFRAWTDLVEDCTALALNGEALDEFLEPYR